MGGKNLVEDGQDVNSGLGRRPNGDRFGELRPGDEGIVCISARELTYLGV
jgi:hypothetical protein